MRELYADWLASDKVNKTKQGNLKAPSKTQMCEFLVAAWGKVTKEMVQKSFKCCGLSVDSNPEDITCLKQGHPVNR